jgi:predicted PhzF superfamily epimerase YddE/YHI9
VRVRMLRVFTDSEGGSGNLLAVVRDAATIDRPARQAIAAELRYSETVFVDPPAHLQIFTPATELPFAGHPLVGCAHLLRRSLLHTPAGDVVARTQDDRAWIRARPEWCPTFARRRLHTPAEVDAFVPPSAGSSESQKPAESREPGELGAPKPAGNLQVWAWYDEARGRIRARVFAPELGIVEDPATGSAAILLCAELDRPVAIEQGPGCEIEARPVEHGFVELGGRVADDGERIL